jgi:hypothetical protein
LFLYNEFNDVILVSFNCVILVSIKHINLIDYFKTSDVLIFLRVYKIISLIRNTEIITIKIKLYYNYAPYSRTGIRKVVYFFT